MVLLGDLYTRMTLGGDSTINELFRITVFQGLTFIHARL